MIGAVEQRHGDVDDGEAQRPVLQIVFDADLHRRDELARDDAAGDLLGELEAGAARPRLDVEHHVAELAVPARLLLVAAAHLRAIADRLLVGNEARLALDRDAVLALQPLGGDAQVHLALAEQQHLVRVGVHLDAAARGRPRSAWRAPSSASPRPCGP